MRALARAREGFTRRFGRPPAHVLRAPGRVELLGNHTDYNDGLVLSAAIDRDLAMAVGPRLDAEVRLVSADEGAEIQLDVRQLAPEALFPWARYPAGVLTALAARGIGIPGFDALIESDVPSGAGLGSSAALEAVTALAVRALQPFRLADDRGAALDDAERWRLAHLLRAAEFDFVGVPCGILDQASVLFGASDTVLLIDCRVPSVQGLGVRKVAFVLADSGEPHSLASAPYAALRDACTLAARKLSVPALRDVAPGDLASLPDTLDDLEARCVRHVVAENERVAQAAKALRAGDLRTVGRLMTESHASSRDLLQNSTLDLDLLVELATADPACFGARLTGGGFGGVTVSLVASEVAEGFAERLATQFDKRTGRLLGTACVLPAAAAG
jgi:galactokinase